MEWIVATIFKKEGKNLILPRFAKFEPKALSKRQSLILVLLVLVVAVLSICGFWWMKNQNINPAAALTDEKVRGGLPRYLYSIGEDTKPTNLVNSTNTLKGPLSVAVSTDRVYVADTGHSLVKVYDREGKFVSSWGQGKLNYPFALTYKDDRLYVADPNLMKVFIFNTEGKEQKALFEKQRLILTNGKEGELIRPTAVQVGVDNLIYVADVGNHVILVLDTSGKILNYIGGRGTGDGKFQYPNALFVDKNGKLYVSDSNNGRIQIFDPNGQFLYKITGNQGKTGQLTLPRGLVVSDSGVIFVVDVFLHVVRSFDEAGYELWAFGGQGSGKGQFSFPNGLCLDSEGRIYVTDRENNRVQVFGY